MKMVTVADLQHDVIHYIELAEEEDILILKNGMPVGFLRGFPDEDALFDYQLESDPRFLDRVVEIGGSVQHLVDDVVARRDEADRERA